MAKQIEKSLYSETHPRVEGWVSNVPYVGKLGNYIIDWIRVSFSRPKFNEDNLELIRVLEGDYHQAIDDGLKSKDANKLAFGGKCYGIRQSINRVKEND